MDRRTFVLLTGATSGALLRPPVRPSASPTRAVGRSGGPVVGRLKFELDEERRWSLWYSGDGPPVPLIKAAVVAARVGDQWVTLADLEDSTVGSRRPPLDPRYPRVGPVLRSRRAGRSDRAALTGGPGGRERVAPHPTAPSRGRYLTDADLLPRVR